METTQKPLMRTIKCTYKLWADYMRTVAVECGVPDSYRVVLPFLLRHPGASQKDIAEYRNITTASVSQIVKEMQRTGFLRKETNSEDARYVKLYLTEKGEAYAKELHDRTKRADEKITQLLSPEKEREMMDLLEELSVILKEKLPDESGADEKSMEITKKTVMGEAVTGEEAVTEKESLTEDAEGETEKLAEEEQSRC